MLANSEKTEKYFYKNCNSEGTKWTLKTPMEYATVTKKAPSMEQRKYIFDTLDDVAKVNWKSLGFKMFLES
jgi:hypothetical protein